MSTAHMLKARAVKNDEFYTRYEDVAAEVPLYDFRGKYVYLNCDTAQSSFWAFFCANFNSLGLRHLTATALGGSRLDFDGSRIVRSEVEGDFGGLGTPGDFRSGACIDILRAADVVVTNPPFSLFREYVELLYAFKKDFLVLMPFAGVLYSSVFPHLKAGEWFAGLNRVTKFDNTDKAVACRWLTTLGNPKKPQLPVVEEPEGRPVWLYNVKTPILNCDKISKIPKYAHGVLGVSVSLFDYDYTGYEILGASNLEHYGAARFCRFLTPAEKRRAITNEKKPPNRITTLWVEDSLGGPLRQIYSRIFIQKEI